MRVHPTRRRGFTLVELMVAAALAILIMAVLSGAFSAALESLSVLKSLGGTAERMRTTTTLLTEDLNAQHLDGGPNGIPRVSDIRYDQLVQLGASTAPPSVTPPGGGFFFLRQANGSTFEGRDQDQVFSTSADGTAGHVLGMCVRRVGKTPEQLFTIDVSAVSDIGPANTRTRILNQNTTDTAPANTYVSQWAEVYWFLDNPQTAAGGPTYYTLYRRARLLTTTVIDNISAADAALIGDVLSLRASPTTPGEFATNTPDTIRVPQNRLFANPDGPYTRLQPGTARFGDDIVMTNVLSFEVKPAWTPGPQWSTTVGMVTNTFAAPRSVRPFVQTPVIGSTPIVLPFTAARGTVPVFNSVGPPPVATNTNDITNGDAPFDDLPSTNAASVSPYLPENTSPAYANKRVFDTWFPGHLDAAGMTPAKDWNNPGSELSIPFRARINAVQIKLRAFDLKNKMTRQASVMIKL